MAKGKATEEVLSDLHGAVAKTLKDNLVTTHSLEDESGESVEVEMVNASVLGQAIKFLKDNNVTAVMEKGDDLDKLADMLKDKPKRGRAQLRSVPAKEAAAEE